jgi:pimeloyl-ACP methyl ester carboxylesterase
VAAKCAPSHLSLAGAVDDQDFPPALYRMAGAGYTVIAPDYSGFSYGQAPGYFNAEDEAHAILDATRAAANVLPTPPTKFALVGHSQGGHAVVAAQSYAASYGHAGTLVGVVAFAPLWTSLDLFAAATTSTANLTTATDVNSILYAMEYAYSAAELDDGSGHGVDVFQSAKQTAAKTTILGDVCYDSAMLQALGSTPADFFDSNYVNVVGNCALGGSCTDQLSATWKARWIADRPAIDPAGAPMLVLFGGQDTFVTVGRQQCAENKWGAELGSGATATVEYNNEPSSGHRDLVRTADVDLALQWIANKAGMGTAPTLTAPSTHTCPSLPANY